MFLSIVHNKGIFLGGKEGIFPPLKSFYLPDRNNELALS